MKNLLLHICCAPCLLYPLRCLKQTGFRLRGLFYNPNIQPQAEYEKRQGALREFISADDKICVDYPQYRPEEFFRAIGDSRQEKKKRCARCWQLRLGLTARRAKAGGYDCFSTTLLVSPYQDHNLLARVGRKVAEEEGIEFYYRDFRPGFRWAQKQAREKNIYRQKYCGCVYSREDRKSRE